VNRYTSNAEVVKYFAGSQSVTSDSKTIKTGIKEKKEEPPPVTPLYQLDKYMIKPSKELKKKRLR
jgi:hypothetical protein